jgi:hypothetical protein
VDEAVADFNRRWDRALAGYAERLYRLDRKIRRFNLLVPLSNRQRHPIRVAERLEEFCERFPRLLVGPGGTVKQVRGAVPEALLIPPPSSDDRGYHRDLAHAAALHEKRSFGKRPPPIG